MSRKYTQKGYHQGERDDSARPQKPRQADGPKSPNMTAFREMLRCGMCGAEVELAFGGVTADAACTKCKADLHTCKNCISFDPGARFECRAGVTARVSSKTTRNSCDNFTPRKRVEKRTTEPRSASSTSSRSSDDPRTAFEKLFKR